jgi:hypothetical protein
MSSAVRHRGKDRPEWRERSEAPLRACGIRRSAVRHRAKYVGRLSGGNVTGGQAG